jgi:hypothetical protein
MSFFGHVHFTLVNTNAHLFTHTTAKTNCLQYTPQHSLFSFSSIPACSMRACRFLRYVTRVNSVIRCRYSFSCAAPVRNMCMRLSCPHTPSSLHLTFDHYVCHTRPTRIATRIATPIGLCLHVDLTLSHVRSLRLSHTPHPSQLALPLVYGLCLYADLTLPYVRSLRLSHTPHPSPHPSQLAPPLVYGLCLYTAPCMPHTLSSPVTLRSITALHTRYCSWLRPSFTVSACMLTPTSFK